MGIRRTAGGGLCTTGEEADKKGRCTAVNTLGHPWGRSSALRTAATRICRWALGHPAWMGLGGRGSPRKKFQVFC